MGRGGGRCIGGIDRHLVLMIATISFHCCWSAATEDFVQGVLFLLLNPEPDDPLNVEAADLMNADADAFAARVAEVDIALQE